MAMKRGPRPVAKVCDTLPDLLVLSCPAGFYPFEVRCGGAVAYTYARTKQDAVKKVMGHLATVAPVPVADILNAAKNL